MISDEPFAMRKMVENLCLLSIESWGGYAFGRDPLCGRVGEEQKHAWIRQANECGRARARELRAGFGTRTAREYADLLHVRIEEENSCGANDYITFASFREPDLITLYLSNIDSASRLITENDLSDLLQSVDIESMLIFHELFHVVESRDSAIFTRATKMVLWKLGPFKNTSALVALSEIAAMAFAQESLSIRYSPYVFDVLLPWQANPQQAQKLYHRIMDFRRT